MTQYWSKQKSRGERLAIGGVLIHGYEETASIVIMTPWGMSGVRLGSTFNGGVAREHPPDSPL